MSEDLASAVRRSSGNRHRNDLYFDYNDLFLRWPRCVNLRRSVAPFIERIWNKQIIVPRYMLVGRLWITNERASCFLQGLGKHFEVG